VVSQHVEGIIRKLAPKSQAWTLGEAGVTPLAQFQERTPFVLSEARSAESKDANDDEEVRP
jgi:hypothetical protein